MHLSAWGSMLPNFGWLTLEPGIGRIRASKFITGDSFLLWPFPCAWMSLGPPASDHARIAGPARGPTRKNACTIGATGPANPPTRVPSLSLVRRPGEAGQDVAAGISSGGARRRKRPEGTNRGGGPVFTTDGGRALAWEGTAGAQAARGLHPDEPQRRADFPAAGPERGGDVAGPREAQQTDGEIAQDRQALRGVARADLRAIIVEGAIADVMQAILDGPVAAHQSQQPGRRCRGEGETGDPRSSPRCAEACP